MSKHFMKDSEIFFASNSYSDLVTDQKRISCEKCGGSGNLKTPENSRRTCLSCFGKGFRISH
tara:strand:- start:2187 stop:2372 length:186 start_codon:yes stop_codon:yes gene_type:complete